MKRSHVFNLQQSAIIKGTYNFDNAAKSTIETIAAARIWRNLGRKAAAGYAAKRGLNISLVRLACQLEAMNKQDLFWGQSNMYLKIIRFTSKNGKTINRKYWSDDGLAWYWIGSRKPYV